MKSLKIKNQGSGFYKVEVTILGRTTPYDFDDHGAMTAFVDSLKDDGYVVANDAY